MENDNLLDRELTAGLDEADPASSGLSAEELHRHDALISRDTQIRSEHVLRLHGFYLGLYRVCSVLLALSLIALLLWGVMGLPSFGSTESPVHNEVSRRYLESGLAEGGATNLVANMILDYRAFDTLGESHVLFVAACAVMLLGSAANLGLSIWSAVDAAQVAKVKNMCWQESAGNLSMNASVYPSVKVVRTASGLRPAAGMTLAVSF